MKPKNVDFENEKTKKKLFFSNEISLNLRGSRYIRFGNHNTLHW